MTMDFAECCVCLCRSYKESAMFTDRILVSCYCSLAQPLANGRN
jgi:hypothetical protein